MDDLVTNEGFAALKRVPCEVYSRIVGYLRPVRDWNRGKQQEFSERKMYNLPSTHADEAVQEPKH